MQRKTYEQTLPELLLLFPNASYIRCGCNSGTTVRIPRTAVGVPCVRYCCNSDACVKEELARFFGAFLSPACGHGSRTATGVPQRATRVTLDEVSAIDATAAQHSCMLRQLAPTLVGLHITPGTNDTIIQHDASARAIVLISGTAVVLLGQGLPGCAVWSANANAAMRGGLPTVFSIRAYIPFPRRLMSRGTPAHVSFVCLQVFRTCAMHTSAHGMQSTCSSTTRRACEAR